jgi:hypothetical protein
MYGPSPPPSFQHPAPTHVNPRCDDVTNLTVDGVKIFTPAVRHIHVKMKCFSLKLNTKAQRGIRGIALLFSALDGFGGQRYASAAVPLG